MFSEILKQLRLKNKLTQENVAEKLGVSRVAYTKYENGQNMPSSDKLEKLADIFNVSVDYLLGRTDDPTPYRDVNADIDAERDFDAELAELLKDEELVAFHDFAGMDDESKKDIIEFIRFKKEQEDKKKGL